MSYYSRKKHHPSNSAPANPLASQSQASTQQLQFPTESQSQSQQNQQSQAIYPWSAHPPPFGQSPSPFLRESHALSTTATAAGELFLFGGFIHSSESASNNLYTFSTRDFSTTLLKTSGQAPNPRYGHRAALTSTALLIWGGVTNYSGQDVESGLDDSLYHLNLVSREWTPVVVNGPGPCGRCYHTVTLVGSKLFVFGGQNARRCLNDIWAFDLNSLTSNPLWESYEPTPGNEKPLPRNGHVSVTTGDRIIMFGGSGGRHCFNDTWSFSISTRKWSELQCTGSIPFPRSRHAAVLVDNVMYVFGGKTIDGTCLGDLTALNLSTQRWTAFQDIGPSPCERQRHVMGSDGRRVFVLGGKLPPGAQVDEAELIHVLDTELLVYSKSDSNTVIDGEASTEHLAKLVAPAASSEKEIVLLEHARIADLERQLSGTLAAKTERDRHIAQLTDQLAQKSALLEQAEANATETGLELRDLKAVRIQLTDQLAQKSALLEQAEANAAETKKHAGLELHELQAKLEELTLSRSEHLRTVEQAQSAMQKATSRAADANERSKRACEQIGEYETKLADVRAELEEKKSELEAVRSQLTDQLAQKSALLEQAEANVAETKKHAGLELHKLQAKLVELVLSRDEHLHTVEQAQSALQKATSRAAEANERSQPAREQIGGDESKLAEVLAELKEKKSELEAVRLRLTDQLTQKSALLEQAEANAAETQKQHARLELHELRPKLDEFMFSRDEHLHTAEQAQGALQKPPSRAGSANERTRLACEQIGEYESKLAEVRAELEEKKSELEAVRLQLTDAKDAGPKSSAKAEKICTQNTAGPVNTDEDRVTPGIMERMLAMEAKIASLQWSEKSFEMMECRNEG